MKESGDRVFHPSFAIASEGPGDSERGKTGNKIFDRFTVTTVMGNLGSCFPVQRKMKAHTEMYSGGFHFVMR